MKESGKCPSCTLAVANWRLAAISFHSTAEGTTLSTDVRSAYRSSEVSHARRAVRSSVREYARVS